MRKAREFELSDKAIGQIINGQIDQAVDAAALKMLNNTFEKKEEAISQLKKELKQILKGEMIYPIIPPITKKRSP